MIHPTSLLLLGPTGSGKTPLGDFVAANGLFGQKCFHFDFGAELRNIAETRIGPSDFCEDDVSYVKRVLQEGALLENNTFHIAANILSHFIDTNSLGPSDLLILNGLPRHKGQADDVSSLVDVRHVVLLECSPTVVLERIAMNTGGDRAQRTDDSLSEIQKKLEIFKQRTTPLVDYYDSKGVSILRIPVGLNTRPNDITDIMEAVSL